MMKVLISDFDIFSSLGGGQTFYRTLIESNPDIQFSFLVTPGASLGILPANVRAIPLRRFYANKAHPVQCQTGRVLDRVIEALNIAGSLQGEEFDVVDSPDYYQVGAFMRPALEFYGVKVGKFALSMHGVISTSLSRNWNGNQYAKADLQTTQMLERLQYESADIRYAISERYAEEWREITGIRPENYDPLRVLQYLVKGIPRSKDESTPPKLVFVGRTEKRKGPDLAIDMVSMLPRELRSPLYFVGPESQTLDGMSSETFLKQHASNRNVEAVFLGKKDGKELMGMLQNPHVVFLPSRYDTFNLLAIESLFKGCPTAIGDGAGVCDFLDSRFPSIPYLKLDTRNPFRNAEALTEMVRNFRERQRELLRALSACDFGTQGPTIETIYSRPSTALTSVREYAESQFQDSLRVLNIEKPRKRPNLIGGAIFKARNSLSKKPVLRRAKSILIAYRGGFLRSRIKKKLVAFVSSRGYYDRFLEGYYLLRALKLRSALQLVSSTGEIDRVTGELNRAKEAGRSFAQQRFVRAKVFHTAAYGEERIGSFAVAAAYGLRVLRWIPDYPLRLVSDVRRWLISSGFNEEASVVDLMFGKKDPAAVQRYLEERRKRLLKLDQPEFEILERQLPQGADIKVSIIVSMYNAASKLGRFLDLISNQTLLRANRAELILVDSGSNRDDIAQIRDAIKDTSFPWIYARTRERETIQSAWNRGIHLSSAPNICFLGVDETLIPEALERLQAALEAEPEVDWVMADSIVTEVTENGEWLRDIMTYNRKGFRLAKHILECCYLSYVGGLYRKAIHERVGYYDPTFRAAGDTEFKNRAMPFIRAKHIPQPLGIFLNYPEERTTQHPRAEIEDLRAWYLFRTEGGLRYLTSNMDENELVELFRDCLGYRKSYCGHISYDLELAAELIPVLRSKLSKYEMETLERRVMKTRGAIQHLEWNCDGKFTLLSGYARARLALRDLGRICETAVKPAIPSAFGIFHDNRFEQHSNVW